MTNKEILAANGLDDPEDQRMHEAMVLAGAAIKRLDDADYARHSSTLRDVLENFGLREEPEKMALEALEADHLQAREDVKRAVDLLRHMDYCRICGDGPWTDCEEGRAALAFLAEVDPTYARKVDVR